MILIELLNLLYLLLLQRFLLLLLLVIALLLFPENRLQLVLQLLNLCFICLGIRTISSNLLLVIKIPHLILEIRLYLLDLLLCYQHLIRKIREAFISPKAASCFLILNLIDDNTPISSSSNKMHVVMSNLHLDHTAFVMSLVGIALRRARFCVFLLL